MKGRELQWGKWWDGLCQSTCHLASESLSSAHWSYQPPHSLPGSSSSSSIDCTAQSCCLQPPYCMYALHRSHLYGGHPARTFPRIKIEISRISNGNSDCLLSLFMFDSWGMVGWQKQGCGTVQLVHYLHLFLLFYLHSAKKNRNFGVHQLQLLNCRYLTAPFAASVTFVVSYWSVPAGERIAICRSLENEPSDEPPRQRCPMLLKICLRSHESAHVPGGLLLQPKHMKEVHSGNDFPTRCMAGHGPI